MTDYFALLGQPRQPWLDPDELKQAFHTRSLESHPDTQPTAAGAEFTQLNEAYQVLQEPKRRLHHLLTLEGAAPQAGANSIPPEIEALFPVVAELTQDANALLPKIAAATNPLTRSLIKPQLLQLQNRIGEALAKLEELQQDSTTRLQHLSTDWTATPEQLAELPPLYLRFSYLTRWTAELRSQQLQLS